MGCMNASESFVLAIGTKKGLWLATSQDRKDWSVKGPLCEGWPTHDLIVDPTSGTIYAATGNAWYGPAVWRSDDRGETWTHSSAGMT